MLADELDYVLGVDTHRDEHVMAVVTAPAGAVVAGAAAPANAHGYRELLRLAEQHAPGRRAWSRPRARSGDWAATCRMRSWMRATQFPSPTVSVPRANVARMRW